MTAPQHLRPCLLSGLAALATAGPTPGKGAEPSVQIDPGGAVSFSFAAPSTASSVLLKASWTDEAKPLKQGPDKAWQVTVAPPGPGIHCYHFLVDGFPMVDPLNPQVRFWQRMENLVEVAGDPPCIWDLRPVPHGAVHEHTYPSDALGVARSLRVYTPPGYEKGSAPYPVLYLLHGWGDTEVSWTLMGKAHRTADNLLAEGKALPMIIAMPYGHAAKGRVLVPLQERESDHAAFEADLLADVIPFVEQRYRTRTEAGQRAVCGLSMGGSQSLRIGLNHPERFHWVGAFSAALFEDPATAFAAVAEESPHDRQDGHLLWFACGTSDGLVDGNRKLHQWLERIGAPHTYKETEGGHDWMVWREQYLPEFLGLLFQ